MNLKKLLAVNPPAKVAANLVLLIASAYMSGSVLVFLPREVFPGRVILALVSIALEILGAYNLALALAEGRGRRRKGLFAAYFVQIAFILWLHVLWGVAEIGSSERQERVVTINVSLSVDTIRQNIQTISNLQLVIGQESKTGFGDRYREALSNIADLRRENERLARTMEANQTNIQPISADTFSRLHDYTGFPVGLAKILVFAILSLVMQYGLFLTAWTLPKDETTATEEPSGWPFIRKRLTEFGKFLDAIYRDGSQAANSNSVVIATSGLPADLVAQFREILKAMKIGDVPLLTSGQGGSTLNHPKAKVLSKIDEYLKKTGG